jgi:hypothetical protein
LFFFQPTTGRIFKVNSGNGTVKEVLNRESGKPLAETGHAIALQSDISIAIATNHTVVSIESDKTWEQVSDTDRVKLGRHEKTVVALAMREGKTYALVMSQGGYIIEEIVWSYDGIWNTVFFVVIILCVCAIHWVAWELDGRGKVINLYGSSYDEEVCKELICFCCCCFSQRSQETKIPV